MHIEGLIKDFILPKNCLQNLQLMSRILYTAMTFNEWEVPTPKSEQLSSKDEFLFKMNEKQASYLQ